MSHPEAMHHKRRGGGEKRCRSQTRCSINSDMIGIRTCFFTTSVVLLGTAATLTFNGCSSDEETGAGGPGLVPPARPDKGTPASSQEKTFAVRQLYLGDTLRTGEPDPNAWKHLGYNLDGKISKRDSTNLCKLHGSAASSVKEDGISGIDNSFGANVLPILMNSAGPQVAAIINQAIAQGGYTILITTTGLTDDPQQTSVGLSGLWLPAGRFEPDANFDAAARPTFTPADNWPVREELLAMPGNPQSAKIRFDDSYIVKGTWVSGAARDIALNITVLGTPLNIPIHRAVLTFNHTEPSKANEGTIAGVLDTEEFILSVRKVAGQISRNLCGGAFESIAQQIRQQSDINLDGTSDPRRMCDGISIGLGFSGFQIANPTMSAPSLNVPDPCELMGDAGATTDAVGGG